jgi:succinate dehydrogenase / fumarate reductase membrane anchor subunit
MNMRSRVIPQRGMNLDYIMWLFMRISGLAMVLLGLLGVIGAAVMGARSQVDLPTLMRWMFFPSPNHVINSDIPDVGLWATAYWQVMQILVVFFGFTHGINGLRSVIEDYVENSFFQIMLRGLIFLVWLAVIIVAVYLALTSYQV